MLIELLANNELILDRVLDADLLDDALRDEACDQWYNDACRAIEDLGHTVERVSNFHKWTGGQGRRHSGTGWRTFDDLAPEQEQAIDTAVQRAIDSIHEDPDYAAGPDLDAVVDAYIVCALWSSIDLDTGEPLDDLYDADDLDYTTAAELREDCADFIMANRKLLNASGLTAEQIGHDFWLTRNHHGSGFWDRGLEAIGEQLTEAAHAYGQCDLYVGDDGRIYC